MKKLGLITLITYIAVSCTKDHTDGFIINANVTGLQTNETAYLNKLDSNNRTIIIDSVNTKEGNFQISNPNKEEIDFNFITFSKTPGNLLVVIDENPVEINVDKSNLRKATVKGSEKNSIFYNYLNEINTQNTEELQLKKEQQVAAISADYDLMKSVAEQVRDLNSKKKETRLKTLNEQPGHIVSIMAIADLLNAKLITSKEAKNYFDKLDSSLKNCRIGKSLNKKLEQSSMFTNEIGDTPDEFTGPTPDGDQLSLKSSLGKLTIIDFWASWCGPCRRENPNVVRVYNKYHDKGLEIIGVSMDKSADKWKEAIEKDKLNWKHVSHLKSWQEPIAKPFGVRSIPSTFLLDENGVIIAKNLRGQDLENKVRSILGE